MFWISFCMPNHRTPFFGFWAYNLGNCGFSSLFPESKTLRFDWITQMRARFFSIAGRSFPTDAHKHSNLTWKGLKFSLFILLKHRFAFEVQIMGSMDTEFRSDCYMLVRYSWTFSLLKMTYRKCLKFLLLSCWAHTCLMQMICNAFYNPKHELQNKV